ncbi:MAG: hypothetical protein FD126_708 [Elusimicrobia bacterium]|nr:MAG: hypothetical protein FD126_708 [Elusimicrobiota bacterium]
MTRRALLAAGLVLLPAAASAASGGSAPLQFLLLDADARGVALGGAYTALAADANALLYNPAWLGAVRRHEASFMHNAHFAGISQDYLALATRWGAGAMVNVLDYGELPRTTVANPNGTLGSYGARDLAVAAGYGHAWGAFHAGAAVKHVSETLDTAVGKAWAADAGVGWHPESDDDLGPSAGLSVQNLGPTVRFQAASENLPTTVRGGLAHEFKLRGQRSLAALDLAKTRGDRLVASLGVETVVAEALALRLGYSGRNQAGWGLTGGIGVNFADFSIDYAAAPFGELGVTHRASVNFRFGPDKDEAAARPVRRPARPELREWRTGDAPAKKTPSPKRERQRDPRKTNPRY